MLKQQLQTTVANIDEAATSVLHTRLSTIQSNDASLAKQSKALHARTQDARKLQKSWNSVVRTGRNAMKVLKPTSLIDAQDLGDAGNWASLLDREITFLEQVFQQTQQQ